MDGPAISRRTAAVRRTASCTMGEGVARRGFFEFAMLPRARGGPEAAPVSRITLEAVKRVDALFAIKREIHGLRADERRRPLVDASRGWLSEQCGTISRSTTVAKAIDYRRGRWHGFALFVDDGRAASRTILQSERSEVLPLVGKPGCSPAPAAAPSVPLPWRR